MELTHLSGTLLAFSLALSFVLSLYFWVFLYGWKAVLLRYEETSFILRRFASVITVVTLQLLYCCYLFGAEEIMSCFGLVFSSQGEALLDRLSFGASVISILEDAVLGLVIISTLFLGPLFMDLSDFISDLPPQRKTSLARLAVAIGETSLSLLSSSLKEVAFWRGIIVAPFFEEITFRMLIIVSLRSEWNCDALIFLSPVLFGVAHLHHVFNLSMSRTNGNLAGSLLSSVAQVGYTTVFGWISSYLFVRTGSIVACTVAHAFCNSMGFPRFSEISSHDRPLLCVGIFAIGLVGFFSLISPLTESFASSLC